MDTKNGEAGKLTKYKQIFINYKKFLIFVLFQKCKTQILDNNKLKRKCPQKLKCAEGIFAIAL